MTRKKAARKALPEGKEWVRRSHRMSFGSEPAGCTSNSLPRSSPPSRTASVPQMARRARGWRRRVVARQMAASRKSDSGRLKAWSSSLQIPDEACQAWKRCLSRPATAPWETKRARSAQAAKQRREGMREGK
jgi:hypothetical protein